MSLDNDTPFALSLSKGATERSEVISLRSMLGFDKLSPNGWGMNK
ncbi:MAG TPA: hypothetical protein VJM09_01605 [Sphingobium sp.]|nr:hypothetical protein [Sphingobium sp.]